MGIGKRIAQNPGLTLLAATMLGGAAGVTVAPHAPAKEYFLHAQPRPGAAWHRQAYLTAQAPVVLEAAAHELNRRQTPHAYGMLEEQFEKLSTLQPNDYPEEFASDFKLITAGAQYALTQAQIPNCVAPCVRGDESFVQQLEQDITSTREHLRRYDAAGNLDQLAGYAQLERTVANHAIGAGVGAGGAFAITLGLLTVLLTYTRKESEAIAAQYAPKDSE